MPASPDRRSGPSHGRPRRAVAVPDRHARCDCTSRRTRTNTASSVAGRPLGRAIRTGGRAWACATVRGPRLGDARGGRAQRGVGGRCCRRGRNRSTPPGWTRSTGGRRRSARSERPLRVVPSTRSPHLRRNIGPGRDVGIRGVVWVRLVPGGRRRVASRTTAATGPMCPVTVGRGLAPSAGRGRRIITVDGVTHGTGGSGFPNAIGRRPGSRGVPLRATWAGVLWDSTTVRCSSGQHRSLSESAGVARADGLCSLAITSAFGANACTSTPSRRTHFHNGRRSSARSRRRLGGLSPHHDGLPAPRPRPTTPRSARLIVLEPGRLQDAVHLRDRRRVQSLDRARHRSRHLVRPHVPAHNNEVVLWPGRRLLLQPPARMLPDRTVALVRHERFREPARARHAPRRQHVSIRSAISGAAPDPTSNRLQASSRLTRHGHRVRKPSSVAETAPPPSSVRRSISRFRRQHRMPSEGLGRVGPAQVPSDRRRGVEPEKGARSALARAQRNRNREGRRVEVGRHRRQRLARRSRPRHRRSHAGNSRVFRCYTESAPRATLPIAYGPSPVAHVPSVSVLN